MTAEETSHHVVHVPYTHLPGLSIVSPSWALTYSTGWDDGEGTRKGVYDMSCPQSTSVASGEDILSQRLTEGRHVGNVWTSHRASRKKLLWDLQVPHQRWREAFLLDPAV